MSLIRTGAIKMKISNFTASGLERVTEWIKDNRINDLTEDELKEALKTVNISFALENINRAQSTLLCELKDSYVQQSQRYVSLEEDAYKIPDLSSKDEARGEDLLKQAFKLYEAMSELKEGEFNGRPKLENYKYGIPIEDARYILPLATTTNISLTMTGNKLYDLYTLLFTKRYAALFKELREKITESLPDSLIRLLPTDYNNNNKLNKIAELYKDDLEKLTAEENMVLLNSFDKLDLKVGLGAATSTSAQPPSKKLKSWGDEAETKARDLAERVLGYGHKSIAEQARTTFGMMCSLVTYHQQIRHRLPELHRERLAKLLLNERPVLIPPTIKDTKFEAGFVDLVKEVRKFREMIYQNYGLDKALAFLLNCDQIKLIISTNARIDQEMLSERICFNAQWEIRELSTKKLLKLRELSDILYENALPSCVEGECKEGKLSCGRQQEMRERFLD